MYLNAKTDTTREILAMKIMLLKVKQLEGNATFEDILTQALLLIKEYDKRK